MRPVRASVRPVREASVRPMHESECAAEGRYGALLLGATDGRSVAEAARAFARRAPDLHGRAAARPVRGTHDSLALGPTADPSDTP